jgi:CBS domain-containing protein
LGITDLQDRKKLEILRSQIEGFKVSDVLDTEYPVLSPDDRVKDALAAMKKSGYQDIPVVEDGNYAGMMSYGTLLKNKGITGESKIKGLVTGVPTLGVEDTIMTVAEKMVQSNSRQLPVLSGNAKKKITGVVSRGAIVDIVSRLKTINEIKVWEIMTNPVESVKSTDTLDTAMNLMRALDIRTVPVVSADGEIEGVLGMSEIIDNNWKGGSRSFADIPDVKIEVSSICTDVAYTVTWDSDLESAADLMVQHGISTVPVLESGKAVGVVTQYDILEVVSACKQRDTLFIQLSGLSEDDKEFTDEIYKVIENEVAKVAKVGNPNSLTIHYAKYKEAGDRQKYSVSARLAVDSEVFTAKAIEWDIIKVTKDLMRKVCDAVMDRKDEKDTYRRRKR